MSLLAVENLSVAYGDLFAVRELPAVHLSNSRG